MRGVAGERLTLTLAHEGVVCQVMLSPEQCGLSGGEQGKRNGQNLVPFFFRCIFSHWDPKTCSVNNLTCAPLGGVESGTGAGREPLSESSPAVPIWSVSTLAAFVHPLSMSLSVHREPHYKTPAFSSHWGRWTSLNGEFCGRT